MATAKLPVIATAGEAIKLPLEHWREFIKFASLPIVVNAFMHLIDAWVGFQKHPFWSILLGLALLIALIAWLTSLNVAWVRLIINGSDSVSRRNFWTFGRVERNFVAGEAVLGLIPVVPFLVAGGIALVFRNETAKVVPLTLVAIGLLIVGIGCSIRLWFILIELALQRYNSWRVSWKQTKRIVWRLIGLSILAPLPFFIGQAISSLVQREVANHAGWLVLTAVAQGVFVALSNAATIGALALAYKFTAPESQAAAVS